MMGVAQQTNSIQTAFLTLDSCENPGPPKSSLPLPKKRTGSLWGRTRLRVFFLTPEWHSGRLHLTCNQDPSGRGGSNPSSGSKTRNMNTCLNCGKELNRKQKNFCSNKCQRELDHKTFIEEWKNGEKDGLKGEYSISGHIKRYLMEKNNCKCEKCGWGEKNEFTGKFPLEIHHKDGNFLNNSEDNLQLLCPNCHSLTETYKAHNRNGRKERKKYK